MVVECLCLASEALYSFHLWEYVYPKRYTVQSQVEHLLKSITEGLIQPKWSANFRDISSAIAGRGHLKLLSLCSLTSVKCRIFTMEHILHLIPAGATAALPDLNWVIKNIHLRG